MDGVTAYSLLRKFQQLQEERVHTYKIFHEGHKIYLSTGPNYDFIQFRTIVQDITQDFKRISEEIIKIECQLRNMEPGLTLHVVKVQDYEKRQLELMARLQLAKQELQDMRHVEDAENDILMREVHHLKKELAVVQDKINQNMEAVCYQLADLM
uniref:Uncharacterized protein n=1 Tax=Daphnia galeata TaxID=27404 RepID=A0A8J2WBR3_9CRUS|nr:unnamed protein product [Daphnia galeata]